jgi:ribosomal protein S18 acetylase RimI-like enzyme/uncharacterized protein YciI
LKIRTARPIDAAVIARILAETFAAYESLYTPEALAAMTPGEDEIKKRFNEAGEIWVAALDGEIVGTVSVIQQNNSLYIRSLAILPAAQGLQTGERLLKEIERYAVAGEFKILTLSTGEFLRRAIRLYERCGFIVRGTLDFYGTQLIAMEKFLDRKMKTLFAVTLKKGTGWDESKPMRSQRFWDEHAAYVDNLAAQGFIVLGGPIGAGEDEVLLIINADDESEIHSAWAEDPWNAPQIREIKEIRRWKILLKANNGLI